MPDNICGSIEVQQREDGEDPPSEGGDGPSGGDRRESGDEDGADRRPGPDDGGSSDRPSVPVIGELSPQNPRALAAGSTLAGLILFSG